MERVESRKIRVAGDDVSCLAANGEFQEFVVLRVAASQDLNVNIDPFRFLSQSREKSASIFLNDVASELFSVQDFVEFSKHGKGKQGFSIR